MREKTVESNFRYLAVGLVALLVLEPLADEVRGRTGDQGRMAAYLEAIVGQLYVAVLVASLVSRHLTSQDQRGT